MKPAPPVTRTLIVVLLAIMRPVLSPERAERCSERTDAGQVECDRDSAIALQSGQSVLRDVHRLIRHGHAAALAVVEALHALLEEPAVADVIVEAVLPAIFAAGEPEPRQAVEKV